ncbi:hypothetical protein F5884DRAFT_768895 [Xylogone sp. PMI_703]|nr:hypothetical protein F5884DRAFT_768895 [Xylogone sp. PMI_703]
MYSSRMATTLTVEKDCLKALSERANLHASSHKFSLPLRQPTVAISKAEHANLLATAQKYTNLCRNLYKGGISDDTLELLIQDDESSLDEDGTTTYSPADEVSNDEGCLSSSTNSSGSYSNEDILRRLNTHSQLRSSSPRQLYEREAKRTVLLYNLPYGVTHADLVNVIRAGCVLDLFLRRHDHSASISFVEESSAINFFRHVQKHGLYIHSQKVDIRWNERQFILYPHISYRIACGATRNLVLYNCQVGHTEEAIRNDLEHIHKLVVISVNFKNGNAHISTNSVPNAIVARTCMISRLTYKGCKIDWDADECSKPIPMPKYNFLKPQNARKPYVLYSNPFEVLGSEDSCSDE